MSQSQLVGIEASRDQTETTALTEDAEIGSLLEPLEDGDCRTILAATSDGARTVTEIVDDHDIAQSTAYRKVEMLLDAGLLEEKLRIRGSGSHVSTYTCRVVDVSLSVDGETGVELSLTRTANDDPFSTDVPRY
ncbi:helix-turn-helix domain-containing protein [Halobacteria archaeon HArc-gm2]|nr:helix-turn-helix domain-containing protein [Halobacteria archaeon HArc-gm2]